MKLKRSLLFVILTLATQFVLSYANPYANYVTSCGKTIVGYEQSHFEFYGQRWDYVASLNSHYCFGGTPGINILQVNCTLAPDPDQMSTYRIIAFSAQLWR